MKYRSVLIITDRVFVKLLKNQLNKTKKHYQQVIEIYVLKMSKEFYLLGSLPLTFYIVPCSV